jgi:hypothetical protein
MKLSGILQTGIITPLTAQDALDEVNQSIADIEDNLRENRAYIRTNPRALGLTRVQANRDQEINLLRSLKRRKEVCLRLLPAA